MNLLSSIIFSPYNFNFFMSFADIQSRSKHKNTTSISPHLSLRVTKTFYFFSLLTQKRKNNGGGLIISESRFTFKTHLQNFPPTYM